MKIKFLFFMIALILFSPKILPGELINSPNLNMFIFSQFFLDTLPGAYFYPSFFENFAPDTTFIIEESNGFSLIDSPRVYFEGDSHTNFNWFSNGYNINSVLECGTPAFLLPLSSINQYELTGESPFYKEYGLNLVSSRTEKSHYQLWAAKVWPHMGGLFPAASFFVNPHPTTEGRNTVLYEDRRKILSNYMADFAFREKYKSSAISLSLTYFDIQRQFNDFNSFNETFNEKGNLILGQFKYEREINNGFIDITAAFNVLSRDRAFAELGRLPQETLDKNKTAFFSGFHLKRKRLNVRFSFCHESNRLEPSRLNYHKDLKDNDGDGFFPFEKWGKFFGNTFRLSLEDAYTLSEQYRDTEIRLFADFKYATIKGVENSFDFNPISFDSSPYLVLLWNEGHDYQNKNSYAKTGTIIQTSLSQSFILYTKLLLQYSSLRFLHSANNLSFLAFGFDAGILFNNEIFKILLAYERMPYEIRENVNFFLERQRPWGTFHFWNDDNQDNQYQEEEEGMVFGFTGGRFHSIDEDIAIPYKKRILLSITTRLSQKFTLNVKGILKNISNNFWVKFKDEHGFYETVDEQDLYFFSEPFTYYSLSNYGFKDHPFYVQLLLHFLGKESQKWFFSFSFLAQMGMGYTPFGNGPRANDIGILDESQANPNSWINGYGRVDGDRAYVAKLYFGFYLIKNLFLGASVKYRDGTPFAFINSHFDHDQWVFYLKTIQAENKKGVKGGPREDYVSEASVKIRYSFRFSNWDVNVFASVFSLLDFGSELSEYVFSGGSRFSNELQIPRSVRAGIVIRF